MHRREGAHHGRRRRLWRQQPQGHLGDDAQGALAADEQFGQRQPGAVLEPRPAQAHGTSIGEHRFEAEDVVARDAVLHTTQAARVGCRVAADGADLERRRIRRIPESVFLDRGLDLGVEQSGLADRRTGDRIDGDVAHLLGGQDDAAVDRRGSSGQPGAGSTRDHRYRVGRAPPHGRDDVLGARRAHHRHRGARVGVERPVLAVARDDVRIGDHRPLGQGGHQVVQHRLRRHVSQRNRRCREVPRSRRSVPAPGVRQRSAGEMSGEICCAHSAACTLALTFDDASWRPCSPTWVAPSSVSFSAMISPPRL